MFTGIIEEKGKVVRLTPAGELEVEASRVLDNTEIGDSIAVSGVCLTVVAMTPSSFTVDVMPETLRRSVLGGLHRGSPVNLERAMQPSGRMGGHIVNGHVDGVGKVRSRRPHANAVLFDIDIEPEVARYAVPRGSITVDGISLTVVEARDRGFSVSIIPHTLAQTTLEDAAPGTSVNVEADIIAKYVEAFLARGSGLAGIEDALERGGYLSAGSD
ncbi:MAG: riboflavin synthase [Candidatus Geothermincolia bacterium]